MSLRKQIRKILREAVGVPEGIHETSETIVKDMVKYFYDFDDPSGDEEEYVQELTFNPPLNITDLSIDKVYLYIRLHKQSFDMEEPQLMGMSVPAGFGNEKLDISKPKPSIKLSIDKDNLTLIFDFALDETQDIDDIYEWFNNTSNVKKITSTISHELMHLYDMEKREQRPLSSLADYASTQEFAQSRIGGICRPILKMFFYLYYISDIENLVRPTELYSHMKANNITKEKFLEEFRKTDIYNNLMDAKNFTIEKLENELLEDFDCVNSVLKENNFPFMQLSPEEKLVHYLNVIPGIVTDTSAKVFFGMLEKTQSVGDDPKSAFAKMLGLYQEDEKTQENKKARFNEYMKKITAKTEDPNIFFDYTQKLLNFKGEQMIKKISKIYSLLPSENENKLQKKITQKGMKESYINKEFYEEKNKREKNYENEIIKKALEEYKKKNPPQK